MAVLALVLIVAWLLLVAGLRGYLHYRRTGDVPWSRQGPPGFAAVVGTPDRQFRDRVRVRRARVHGDDYRRYAASTGRFLPWIGRVLH